MVPARRNDSPGKCGLLVCGTVVDDAVMALICITAIDSPSICSWKKSRPVSDIGPVQEIRAIN